LFSPLCLSGLMTDWIRVGRRDALDGALGMQKEREKLEREKQRDRITNAVASKEDAAKSVKPQHVETVKKKTGSKPKIAPLSTQAAQQVFSLHPPRTLPANTTLATLTLLLPLRGAQSLGVCIGSNMEWRAGR